MKVLRQQLLQFILYACIIVAAVGAFSTSGIVDVLDRYILLENTHPAYHALTSNASIQHIPTSMSEDRIVNQVVNAMGSMEYDQGFTITVNADGSFTYSGTNNSDGNAYVGITNGAWTLHGGTYVLSDSQNGIPVSTDGLMLCVMARKYHVGGEIEYVMVADMTNPESTIFTTNYNELNDYYIQLVVAPGYSADGITIYPMLTTYEDRTLDYQQCLFSNAWNYVAFEIDTTAYSRMSMSKQDYLALSDEDHTLLNRYIKYQAPPNGDWTTIDFGDGTGLYYPNNDPDRLQYGELNAAGQISLLFGDEDSIILPDLPLEQTTDLITYLEMLNNPDYTILIAVRDEGVAALTDYTQQLLEELGVTTPLSEQPENSQRTYYGQSYYAVLNPGQTSVEAVSTDELNYTGTTRDGQHSFALRSRGYTAGDGIASITLDGVEYAMNRRGMNIVVYDNETGAVVDQVTYDTGGTLHAYRDLQGNMTE